MSRIAVGGFQHETNTFSSQPAALQDFLDGSGWPGLLDGQALFDVTAPINLPVAGAVRELRQLGHDLVPLVWTAATPSGRVTRDAFEDIVVRFLAALADAGPLDGVYLDLHGAMAVDGFDDGEGEFLRRLRAALPPGLPLVASLDLHANVSQAMVDLTDAMVAYRAYPHVDMDVTGVRAAQLLHRILADGPLEKAFVRVDFLASLTSQCTLVDPGARLYARLEALEHDQGLASLNWTGGFALADVPDAGQAVFGYGAQAQAVRAAVQALADDIARAEPQFNERIWTPAEAVAHAVARQPQAHGPVILADTQDNPGGGGSSDTTGMLRALLQAGANNAVVAMLCDPESAAAAHRAGVGASLTLDLGGRTPVADGVPGEPCRASYTVEFLSDGRFTGTGPMWKGSPIDLGPLALLRVEGVRVIVVSGKMQAADRSILRHVGMAPEQIGILALKSSVHFRADFQDIADSVLVVESPGLVCARLSRLSYRNLRAGMRLPQ